VGSPRNIAIGVAGAIVFISATPSLRFRHRPIVPKAELAAITLKIALQGRLKNGSAFFLLIEVRPFGKNLHLAILMKY
jgi:hypothetical protein